MKENQRIYIGTPERGEWRTAGELATEARSGEEIGTQNSASLGLGGKTDLPKTTHATGAGSGDIQRDDASVLVNSVAAPSPAATTTCVGPIFVQCMTCGAVKDGETWRPLTEGEYDRLWFSLNIQITPGCCPDCSGDFMAQARRLHRQQQKQLA